MGNPSAGARGFFIAVLLPSQRSDTGSFASLWISKSAFYLATRLHYVQWTYEHKVK